MYERKSHKVTCSVCFVEYETKSYVTKYCSSKCKHALWRKEHGDQYFDKYYQKVNRNKSCITCNKPFIDPTANNLKVYCSLKCNTTYQVGKALRTRINHALNAKRSVSLRDLLGCSVEELKKHLESQWKPGMSWDNWGIKGWHIDHIKPLAAFDLTDLEQLKVANNYTILQPLWAKDNISKGDKY